MVISDFASELDLTSRFLGTEQLVLLKQGQQPLKDWPCIFSDYCWCVIALVEGSVFYVIGTSSALLPCILRHEFFALYEPFLEDGPAISTILETQGLPGDERVLVMAVIAQPR